MKTIHQQGDFVLKIGKNGLGKWGVWKGSNGKANILVYKRFFSSESIAEKWAKKWLNKK
jgi:hypothetical protein